uniref:Uncharacterized protein n=1 Tax=Tanacetum cinerariifolium TaxID=118510 RepID=A0A699ICF1_TANCI|nr:hypothetical protein [Tanacetum cinerariifolium]
MPCWESYEMLLVDGTWGKIKGLDHLTSAPKLLDGYDDSLSSLTQQAHMLNASQKKHKKREPRFSNSSINRPHLKDTAFCPFSKDNSTASYLISSCVLLLRFSLCNLVLRFAD